MTDQTDNVTMASELTAAWLNNPHTRASGDEVAAFLASMHKAVAELASPVPEVEPITTGGHEPAVSVRRSLASPDHIISMIDGKKYRALKRHLTSKGLTPEQYRERYSLKADYPMVAPAYSAARSAMAKTIGLGRKAGTKVAGKVRKSGKEALTAARAALGQSDDKQS